MLARVTGEIRLETIVIDHELNLSVILLDYLFGSGIEYCSISHFLDKMLFILLCHRREEPIPNV